MQNIGELLRKNMTKSTPRNKKIPFEIPPIHSPRKNDKNVQKQFGK